MILYKYISSEAGLKILESNSLAFTQPYHFNDPFELKASQPCTIDNTENEFNSLESYQMSQFNGVLSLTRQPLNPLMWAHYGDSHTGMVIGIDCSISDFTCEKKNLLPVQFGSVIYTNEKPNSSYISKSNAETIFTDVHHFPLESFEKLQRVFLFKGMMR